MGRIMIVWIAVCGLISAVLLDPYEFWIDAHPQIALGCGFGFLSLLGLAFWMYCVAVNRRDEAAVALTSYIFTELTSAERLELAEPDPRYHPNAGIMRWKKTAPESYLSFLLPANPPKYAQL